MKGVITHRTDMQSGDVQLLLEGGVNLYVPAAAAAELDGLKPGAEVSLTVTGTAPTVAAS